MNKTILLLLIILILSALSCGKKKETEKVKGDAKDTAIDHKQKFPDYLQAGNSITFDNEKYDLVWSAHPSGNYYKQEYLRGNDTLDKFEKLILIEAVTGNSNPKDAAMSKVSEIRKMKEVNPMVNYDIFEKEGEVMLDFLLSQQLPDGKNVVERNVYRYLPLQDKGGKKGILLFGISERAYGDDVSTFLVNLKQKRFDIPNSAGKFTIPEIKITD